MITHVHQICLHIDVVNTIVLFSFTFSWNTYWIFTDISIFAIFPQQRWQKQQAAYSPAIEFLLNWVIWKFATGIDSSVHFLQDLLHGWFFLPLVFSATSTRSFVVSCALTVLRISFFISSMSTSMCWWTPRAIPWKLPCPLGVSTFMSMLSIEALILLFFNIPGSTYTANYFMFSKIIFAIPVQIVLTRT